MAADDLSQIVNLANLYAIAVDSHRYELFREVFTADITCDFGGGAAFSGIDLFIDAFGPIHAVFASTQHMVTGHAIRVDGDRAHCFSYVCGRFRRALDDGIALFESNGWYDDVLVRTPAGWRIRERISRMVSYSGDIRVMQAMPGVDTAYHLVALADEADAGRVRFLAQR